MKKTDPEMPENISLYERYTNYTDAEIQEILKNHKNFRATAVDAAVKIAVERKLINSEQDLLAPEFQNVKSNEFSFFPVSTNTYHLQKVEGSIFRFLYVTSFIPVIYGFLKYGEGQLAQTYLGVGIGLIWFLLCLLLKKTQKLILLLPIFTLLLSISGAVGLKIFSREPFLFLDLVMLIICTLLPAYLLMYLKKLIQQKSEKI